MFAAPGGAAGSPRLYWNDPQASTSLRYKMPVKKVCTAIKICYKIFFVGFPWCEEVFYRSRYIINILEGFHEKTRWNAVCAGVVTRYFRFCICGHRPEAGP